jgi:hypothetical protein
MSFQSPVIGRRLAMTLCIPKAAALEHGDLVAQSGDLGLLGGASLKRRGKQSGSATKTKLIVKTTMISRTT